MTDLGTERVVAALESAKETIVPAAVLGALHAGFRLGPRESENVRELHQFLERPGVKIRPVDQGVARRYGDLVATLKRLGTPIPTNDIWTAAVAIGQNGELLTRDGHFKTVPLLCRYG